MPDLSLIPLDDLMAEVASRFDAYVFGGYRETGEVLDDQELRFEGQPLMCQGLCMELVHAIVSVRPGDEEDGDG